MGFIFGFLISLFILFPAYIFITIFLAGPSITVANYFTELVSGGWIKLIAVCETAIMEPINVIFASPVFLRILFAYLPWVVVSFIAAFFFRKKKAAIGGMLTTITILFGVGLVNQLVIQTPPVVYDVAMLTQANIFYGYLIAIAVTLIIGSISGLISPFKKDRIPGKISLPTNIEAQPGPYYMPTESPSRDQYMETNHAMPTQRQTAPDPMACEYCGSYLDPDTEYCSVCGNRVYDEH
ncbi:MAG: hypothetical protein ACTSO7_12200 [Candidatus Heimdallarchaeota archaeon]